MRNSTKLLFRLFIAVLLLGSIAKIPALAQDEIARPGVVSQLTLDDEGRIQCKLHTHDQVSAEHSRTIDQNARLNAASKMKKKKGAGGATIIVDFYNLDPTFTGDQLEAAKAAFQSAADIWAKNIYSEVPIYVAAVFQPLGPGVLGSAGSGNIYANYPGMQRETWYGNALADKLVGEDVNPAVYDITARFSTVFPNWYFGTDGNTPEFDYDFRTVVLHELCHGLGFFGSMAVDNGSGIGYWGFGITDPLFPTIYDRYVYDRPGKLLIKKYPNYSTELGDVLLDDPVVFRGPNTVGVTKGKGAKIFTVLDSEVIGDIPGFTDIWLPGSSYSHLDYLTYAEGENGLMVPFLSTGLAYDEPGAIVKAIFDDIGWNGKVRQPVVETEVARMVPFPNEEVASELNVYPNRVLDQFVLDLGSEEVPLQRAQMIDILGRALPLTFTKSKSRYVDFDLSTTPMKSGLYLLQLEFDNSQVEVIRIAKE